MVFRAFEAEHVGHVSDPDAEEHSYHAGMRGLLGDIRDATKGEGAEEGVEEEK